MSWWHHDNGDPAPWGKGRFDPTHLLIVLAVIALMVLAALAGKGQP